MPHPYTLRPNGPLIRKLRIVRGWSQAVLAWQTQEMAERIDAEESAADSREQRAPKKTVRRLAGISANTVYRVENNLTEVYPKTLWIIARTLNVSMEMLIDDDEAHSASDKLLTAEDNPAPAATRRHDQPEKHGHPSPDL